MKDFLCYVTKSWYIPTGIGLLAYLAFTGVPSKLAGHFIDWLFQMTNLL